MIDRVARIFAIFCHVEAISGLIALGVALAFLICSGHIKVNSKARIIAGLAGLLLYGLGARFIYGAHDYFWILSSSAGFGQAVIMLGAAIVLGIVTGAIGARASHGETQRMIAIFVTAFAAGFYIHGYHYIWSIGMSAYVVPMLPFICFTGGAAMTFILILYGRGRAGG